MRSRAPRGPRALTMCLAASGGAHLLGALLALLLVRTGPEPGPEPEPAPVVVELVEPHAAPAAAPRRSGPEERVSVPPPPRAERRRARPAGATRSPSTASAAKRPDPPVTATDSAPTPLSLAMRTPALDLRPFAPHSSLPRGEIPRAEPRGSAGAGRGGGGRTASGGTRADEDRRIKATLDRLLAEDQARRDTRAGKVPPLIFDIMRDADKVFAPPWEMIEADSRKRGTMGATAKSMLRGWLRSYLAGLKAYRKMGSSLPGDRERDEPAMLSAYAELLRAAAKEAEALECEVCVDLVPGQPPQVHVARRSGRPSFDRMAKEALALAARVRALQIEQERAGDKKAVEACYHFTAKFHRVPPLPTVMCSFDESKPSISCLYPGKKIVSKGVRLVIVRVKKSG